MRNKEVSDYFWNGMLVKEVRPGNDMQAIPVTEDSIIFTAEEMQKLTEWMNSRGIPTAVEQSFYPHEDYIGIYNEYSLRILDIAKKIKK